MKAKDFIPASKPRNFVAKNQQTAGAGAHRDKKKAQKQGYEKHKGKGVREGDEPDEQYLDKVISDLYKDTYGMRPDHEFGREWMSSNYEEKLEIYNSILKNLHSDMDEGIGGTIAGGVGQFIGNKIDPLHGEILRTHGEMAGRKAEYIIRKYMHLLQKSLKKQLDSGEKEGVREGSDFGEPKEILADVLDTLEREVEWPLTEVMDYEEVLRLLAPIKNAVNQRLKTMDKDVSEAGYNPLDYERDQIRQMDYEKRAFKRAELQHELGHEDDPDFERKMMQKQMDKDKGPWYIRIDGKIYKQKGEAKVFDWKKGANNYALAMVKNRPELKDKIMLTRKPVDESSEIPFTECPECRGPIFHESLVNEKQDACYHKVRSRYKVWPSAYASGALVQCRKKGAKNWGNKSKK